MQRSGKFPRGWNAARVARVLVHYEEQTEAEAVAEVEAAFGCLTETTMPFQSSSFRRFES